MSANSWGFYGRREELARLCSIVRRGRWFFARVSGRRRIGKTSLVQQALQSAQRQRVLYKLKPPLVSRSRPSCVPETAWRWWGV